MIALIFTFCYLLLSLTISAQKGEMIGHVYNQQTGERVSFARVYVLPSKVDVLADENGSFTIQPLEEKIIISAMGYKTDTFRLSNKKNKISLALSAIESNLPETVISANFQETAKTESPIPVEVYTAKLFRKNPSANLFEALNMVNGVQPQLNCNVCNTGDIHINGMEGPYTMILVDGMPVVSSLSTVYGLMGIPQSLIRKIEVVKGPASTLYGSEALAGVVNVITNTPGNSPRLNIEQTVTSAGEVNTDLASAFKLKKAQTLIGANYYNFWAKWDINKDNFTDVTLQNRLSVFNKWNFELENGKSASLALRYIYENRWGGEMNWNKKFRGTDSIYGESIYTHRIELLGNYQLPVRKENLQIDYCYNFHYQDSYYGTVKYLAKQHVFFAQLRWFKSWKKVSLLSGIPFRVIYYDDNTPATSDENMQNNQPSLTFLPGVFTQTEWKPVEKFALLVGMRYEYHNVHKSIFSPRIALKISPTKEHTIRISAGNGFRVVNLFTEDHAALTGARKVVIAEKLKPEQSWNISLNYNTTLQHRYGFTTMDVSGFYTHFTNKIVADFFSNPSEIIYTNLKGYAVSTGASFNIDFSFTNGFKIMLSGTYMKVYQVNKLTKTPQLHAPDFSANYALSYTISKIGLGIDFTGKLTSPMYLPVVPNDFRPAKSPWFCIMNIQFTKKFNQGIELFAGVKNLLHFIPKDPILRAEDPFNKNVTQNNPNGYTFDPSYNYAPIQGAKGFIGFRYTLR